MSGNRKSIFRQHVLVVCELSDGREAEIDLMVDMRDQGKYERARRSLNLPAIGEEGMIAFFAGSAYYALKRSKSEVVDGISLETWLDERCMDASPVDENGNATTDKEASREPVDPTNLALTPG